MKSTFEVGVIPLLGLVDDAHRVEVQLATNIPMHSARKPNQIRKDYNFEVLQRSQRG